MDETAYIFPLFRMHFRGALDLRRTCSFRNKNMDCVVSSWFRDDEFPSSHFPSSSFVVSAIEMLTPWEYSMTNLYTHSNLDFRSFEGSRNPAVGVTCWTSNWNIRNNEISAVECFCAVDIDLDIFTMRGAGNFILFLPIFSSSPNIRSSFVIFREKRGLGY